MIVYIYELTRIFANRVPNLRFEDPRKALASSGQCEFAIASECCELDESLRHGSPVFVPSLRYYSGQRENRASRVSQLSLICLIKRFKRDGL